MFEEKMAPQKEEDKSVKQEEDSEDIESSSSNNSELPVHFLQVYVRIGGRR